MGSARIHQICSSQLFNVSESLKLRSVDDLHHQGVQLNVSMNGVIEDLQKIQVNYSIFDIYTMAVTVQTFCNNIQFEYNLNVSIQFNSKKLFCPLGVIQKHIEQHFKKNNTISNRYTILLQ